MENMLMSGRRAKAIGLRGLLGFRLYRLSFPLFSSALVLYAASVALLEPSGERAVTQLCLALVLAGAAILLAIDRPDARTLALTSTAALLALVAIRLAECTTTWWLGNFEPFAILVLVLTPVFAGIRALFLASWCRAERLVSWLSLVGVGGGWLALAVLAGYDLSSRFVEYGIFWPVRRG